MGYTSQLALLLSYDYSSLSDSICTHGTLHAYSFRIHFPVTRDELSSCDQNHPELDSYHIAAYLPSIK